MLKKGSPIFLLIFVLIIGLIIIKNIGFFNLRPQGGKKMPILSNDKGFQSRYSGQVIYHGKPDKKQIALTFDADMTYGMEKNLKSGTVKSYYNKDVIDILEKEKVPATLFLAGLWAKNYPEITKSLSENPLFEIGNHSFSHPSFTDKCYTLTLAKDKDKEFKDSQEILTKITGKTPTLFRFPGGCFNKDDLNLAKKYNLVVVGWDVNSGDAFNKNKDQIIRNVERKTQNGSIIVMHMHDGGNAPMTDDALPEIIRYLKGQGYQFVKAGELIRGLTLE